MVGKEGYDTSWIRTFQMKLNVTAYFSKTSEIGHYS